MIVEWNAGEEWERRDWIWEWIRVWYIPLLSQKQMIRIRQKDRMNCGWYVDMKAHEIITIYFNSTHI